MSASKYIKRTVSLDGSPITEQIPASFFNGERDGHTFIIDAIRDGEPFPFNGQGSVVGTFLNANDETVTFYGGLLNGAAYITLDNGCYHVNGRFTFTISVGNVVVYECQSMIKRRSSSTYYDPSHVIPTIEELLNEIAAMRAATAEANAAATAAGNVDIDLTTGTDQATITITRPDGTEKSQTIRAVVGDDYNKIKPFNAYNYGDDLFSYTTVTHQGITFNWSGETCHVSGTSNGGSVNQLLHATTETIPPAMKSWKKFYVKYATTDTKVILRIIFRDSTGTSINKTKRITKDDELIIPDDAVKWSIQLFVENGNTVDCYVSNILFLTMETNEKLLEIADEAMKILPDGQVDALTSILDVPVNKYFTISGDRLINDSGTPGTDEYRPALISNPPEGISANNMYVVRVWCYATAYKICEIFRSSDAEHYFGVTFYGHTNEFLWYDRSYAKKIENIESAIGSIESSHDALPRNHFIISTFEEDGHWYNENGVAYDYGSTVKTAPIRVEAGRTYYSAWAAEDEISSTPCRGAWLDENKQFLSPILILSPYREVSGVSKILYLKNGLCVKGGKYYRCLETMSERTAWDASKWQEISKPEGCAEIVDYDLPEAGQSPVSKWWHAVSRTAGLQYANLYSLTAPEGAAYIVLNLRSTYGLSNYDVTGVQYISTLPLFSMSNMPNRFWRDTDYPYSKWQHKRLCIIGQSSSMIDRMLRTLPNDLNGTKNGPVVGFQEYLIPFFKSVTTYGFSGQNYMRGDGATIYDGIITAQKDLSPFDFFVLKSGGNGIPYTSHAASENKIGTFDSTDVDTMCGGMNAMIDYILDQTQDHAEPPRIWIDTMPMGPSTYAANDEKRIYRSEYMFEQIKKLCEYRRVNLIDRAAETDLILAYDSASNSMQPYQGGRMYYDMDALGGTHLNSYGNRIHAEAFLRELIGV